MYTTTGLNNICLFAVLERPIFKEKAISLSACFLSCAAWLVENKCCSFFFVCVVVAIICKLLDLAQVEHGKAQQLLMHCMYSSSCFGDEYGFSSEKALFVNISTVIFLVISVLHI